MSVSDSFTLPAQPAAGLARYKPLGGNGYSAPHSEYFVSVNLAGDATGGLSTITITLDSRYEGIVVLCQSVGTTVSAAVESEIQMQRSFAGVNQRVRAQGLGIFDSNRNSSVYSWTPPLMLDPLVLQYTQANVDTDTHNAYLHVLNFNKRASEITPLSVLMQSLPRAEAQNVVL